MDAIKLTAEHRTTVRKKLGALRREGWLPAVMYGTGKTPVALQMNSRETGKTINRIQGTSLIDLTIGNTTHKTLVREVQRNFVTDEILHIDFYEVAMDRVMRVKIPVRLTGNSYAVTSLGGVLVRGVPDLEIECLPGDLVSEISADLSVLKEINTAISVSQLKVPEKIKVLTNGDEMIARVTYASLEEIATVKPEVTGEVEVVEKGKKEEGAEGETPATASKVAAPAKAAAAPAKAATPAKEAKK